ncbi:MAG: lipopolysaccharide assembly protein LapA domain-containing protein [Acidimicrobiales bacterium]
MPSPEVQFETVDDLPANDRGSDAVGTRAKGRGRRGRRANTDGARHTRISGAWVAVAVAVVLGAALIDFIVQNTRSVRIEFFAANGQMPVAVALLGAALAGAFLVLAVGVARTTQLRLANRRGKKLQKQTESLVTGSST